MICSKCKKRPAVVFVQRMENGQPVSEGLCWVCAKEAGLPQAEQNIIFTFLCDASVDMFCKWVEDGKQIPLERVIEMTSQLLMHGQMGFVKAHGR